MTNEGAKEQSGDVLQQLVDALHNHKRTKQATAVPPIQEGEEAV